MLNPSKEANMGSKSGIVDTVRDSMCFQTVLGFFFNKGVRGGPRVLMNLAGVLLALIIFVKLLPQHMAESALQSIPQSVWSSLGTQSDGSVPGGLRIVVFGENDVGTPVGMTQEMENSKSWTEALCDKLHCTNYISMVPSPDAAPYSMSSNELYALGMDKVFNETYEKEGPGYDYSYVTQSYPPQWKSSDLKDQIDKFLAMPKPRHASGETLWVFSFGMWDVWALSALPINSAKDAVGVMTKDIFEQIERLYAASMDPESIAYSDIDTIVASSNEDAANETKSEARDEGEAQAEESTKPVESFRILVPRIIDPSVLPGWRDLRPQSPAVHSKAEQMRNAYALTNTWNDGIVNALSDWVKKENPKEEGDGQTEQARRSTTAEAENKLPRTQTVYPTRDGYAYNLADYLIDAMLERQMHNAKLTDGQGHGQGELEDGFRDVRNACLQPLSSVPVSVSTKSGVTLNLPYQKLEGDKQAITGELPAGVIKRDSNAADEDEKKRGLTSAVRQCDIPSDHLFYTPFALSQRAIQDIAAETAEMIHSGETVRTKLGV